MTQIKFCKTKSGVNSLESIVNEFLREYDGIITVRDIKYSVETYYDPNRSYDGKIWTAMVIYDAKEPIN